MALGIIADLRAHPEELEASNEYLSHLRAALAGLADARAVQSGAPDTFVLAIIDGGALRILSSQNGTLGEKVPMLQLSTAASTGGAGRSDDPLEQTFDLGSVLASALRMLNRGDMSQQSRIEIVSPFVPTATTSEAALQDVCALGTISIRFTHVQLGSVLSSQMMAGLQLLNESLVEYSSIFRIVPCAGNTEGAWMQLGKAFVNFGSISMQSKLCFADRESLPIHLRFSLLVETALSYASAAHFMHPGTRRLKVIGRVNLASIDQALVWGFPFIVTGSDVGCESLADFQARKCRLQAIADALNSTDTGMLLSCVRSGTNSSAQPPPLPLQEFFVLMSRTTQDYLSNDGVAAASTSAGQPTCPDLLMVRLSSREMMASFGAPKQQSNANADEGDVNDERLRQQQTAVYQEAFAAVQSLRPEDYNPIRHSSHLHQAISNQSRTLGSGAVAISADHGGGRGGRGRSSSSSSNSSSGGIGAGSRQHKHTGGGGGSQRRQKPPKQQYRGGQKPKSRLQLKNRI